MNWTPAQPPPTPADQQMLAVPRLPPRRGVVLYAPGGDKSSALLQFATALRERGWRVGGVVIDTLYADGPGNANAPSIKTGLDFIDLADGKRIPLARPDTSGITIGRWVLDPAALAHAEAAIRRAVSEKAELIVVDKFGPLEGRGEGFHDALLAALASSSPLLVAVRGEFADAWDRFTAAAGHRQPWGELLRGREDALWRWWGPERLAADLVRGVPPVEAKRVVIGVNWVLVEAAGGCGLAHAPPRDAPGCRPLSDAGGYAGRRLDRLAALTGSDNPFEAAIGWAAMNAHYNAPDNVPAGSNRNGLDEAASRRRHGGISVVIGRFPGLDKSMPGACIIERAPRPGEFREQDAAWLLPQADVVAITGSTLENGSLPGLLRHCAPTGGPRPDTVLVGPSTPLAPALHSHGLDVLSGLVIEDADLAARIVAEGGAVRALRRAGRMHTLIAPRSAETDGPAD